MLQTFTNRLTTAEVETRPILEDITIVIPTLGRPILETCLSRIVDGRAWPEALIIVDQGTNPQVAAWIKTIRNIGIKAEHIPSSQSGRAAGVNRGLERVKTRFVAVTDDDCFVDENWLSNIADRLRLNPESVITGRVEAAGEDMLEEIILK